MKKILIILMLLGAFNISASAQSCPVTSSSFVPKNAATWNWEEPMGSINAPRQQYCDTWNAYIAPGSSIPYKVNMGAPWDSPTGATLLAINLASDFQKANGWELLKLDFGGGTRAIAAPYFVLYQKTTGTIRVYSYVNNPGILTGLVFTMRHSTTNSTYSGQSTSNLSLGRYPVVAPDKYLSQPSNDPVANKEVITYVSFYAGPQKWAMGQFNILLDPNVSNSSYNLNALEFQIFGLVKSEVAIDGSFQFTTDYAMGGSADKVPSTTDPSKIIGDGQRFLGNIISVTDKIKEINSKATAFSTSLGTSPSDVNKGLKDATDKVKDATSGGTLKPFEAIANLAGTFSGFFGLAGSVIALFDGGAGGAGKSAFVPTSSKGTIKLTGTITVQTPLVGFSLLTPGTNHYANNSGSTTTPQQYYTQLPYYNCPLGIFNLQSTPVLKKVDYTRYSRAHFLGYDFSRAYNKNGFDPTVPCTSYQLNAQIIPVVNNASGLVIRSVKYSICRVFPLSDFNVPYITSADRTGLNYTYIRDYKFIYSQVAHGALEINPYEPQTGNAPASVIVQTPYTDARCPASNGLPFNCQTPTSDSPVFLRVIAELVSPTAPANTPPLYFSQDYAVDLIDDPNSSNYQNRVYFAADAPPYNLSNKASIYVPNINPYSGDITDPETTLMGNLSYGGSYTGTTSSPIGAVASRTLTFYNNSSVTVSPRDSRYNYPVIFQAGNAVQIQGTLDVAAGNTLYITTDLGVISDAVATARTPCVILGPYTGNLVTFYPQCGYDTNATSRVLSSLSPSISINPELIVFPNPASTSATAQLTVGGDECIERIELVSMSGQVNWRQSYSCAHKVVADVPINGLVKGLYILQAKTDKHIYSTKLSVE